MSRIAVVGSGIAGLGAAWLLSRVHEVVLFESGDYLGGHTHTHEVVVDGANVAVDSGFIVFNPMHYPLLTAMFEALGVATQPTTMGFSVQDQGSGLEYSAGTLRGLLAQPGNMVKPGFWRMLADLRRFYREAPAVMEAGDENLTLGRYLELHRYSSEFRDLHIVPMASALWSSPSARILEFPVLQLVRFMHNHDMLQVSGRPQWRVVRGGSQRYVDALSASWKVDARLRTAVASIRRKPAGVQVTTAGGIEDFDQVVLACHADDALGLLADATPLESAILGAISYQHNDAVLHTDARVMPVRSSAWAAWNAYVPHAPGAPCSVSYWMNALQGLQSSRPLLVTLNRNSDIDPGQVLKRMRYRHPHQTAASVAARKRKAEIQGLQGTWFAGAGWGFGFHEDGLRSGVDVANALGVQWP